VSFLKRFTKPKTSVSMTVGKTTVQMGDDLKGAITVSVDEEYDATEIRAELRCVEKRRRERWVYDQRLKRQVRQVYWDVATLHSDDPKVCGAVHLIPGLNKTFPLSVNIPIGGRESFDGMDASVSWHIKGVVAIKGRPDVTSDVVELQVIKSTALPASMQEREVVMVPCEYCQGLMPQTSTACPNCGAPRKS
jgi:hypothetical protein